MTTRQQYIDAIDPTYPVAGQDNSSQGFRDNFSNIKNALNLAGGGGGAADTTPPATPISTGTVFGYTVNQNAFLGNCAGNLLTTGAASVAIGYEALKINTGAPAVGNIAVGHNSLKNLDSSSGLPAEYFIPNVGVYDNNNSLIVNIPTPFNDTLNIDTGARSYIVSALVPIAAVTDLAMITTPDTGNNNDGYFTISDIPFNINFNGNLLAAGSGNNVYVGTNGYITFFQGLTNKIVYYSSWTEYTDAVAFAPGDCYVDQIYTGVEGVVGSRIYRIVIEGYSNQSLPSIDLRVEFIFHEAAPDLITLNTELSGAAGLVRASTIGTAGLGNIAVGVHALSGNIASVFPVVGKENIGIGTCALLCNSAGYGNIALGGSALMRSEFSTECVCVHYGSGCYGGESTNRSTTIGSRHNVAIGSCALCSQINGAYNVAIGPFAGSEMATGCYNIAIGYGAGCGVSCGCSNTIIGSSSGYIAGLTDTVVIAAGQTERIKVDGSGLYVNGTLMSAAPKLDNYCNFVVGSSNFVSGVWPYCGNIAIGSQANFCNFYGANNTALGQNALQHNYRGNNNFAQGICAMFSSTCGNNNFASGACAAYSNTLGCNNFSQGCQALFTNRYGCNNFAQGSGALYYNLASNNFAQGLNAMYCNVSGSNNFASGNGAMYSSCSGNNNFAQGYQALSNNVFGCDNFAQGFRSLSNNCSGNNNFAQGRQALRSNISGCNNVAIGCGAMYGNIAGNSNIAIGCSALLNSGTGCYNTALGQQALQCNITGSNNIAVGFSALYFNKTGNNNTAIGCQSLYCNLTSENIAIGIQSTYWNTSGCRNVAIGSLSLFCNVIGQNNIALGTSAGFTNTSGCNNIFIGCNAQGVSAISNNTITFGDSNITTIRAQVTSITALSDCRDKTNIAGIPIGLNFIKEVNPVQFTWNMRDGSKVGIPEMGFIAQELDALQQKYGVESALGLVLKDNSDRLEATPGKLLPVIVKAIQELAVLVDQLTAK